MTDLIEREAALALLETAAKGTIILGGQKYRTIQLGEITTAIRSMPAVKESLTTSPLSDPRVKALVEAVRTLLTAADGESYATYFGALEATDAAMKALREKPNAKV